MAGKSTFKKVSPSVKKRIRQTAKRRLRNRMLKARMRTSIKTFLVAVKENDFAKAETLLKDVTAVIYKTASKGSIHARQASRRVSRLASLLNTIKPA